MLANSFFPSANAGPGYGNADVSLPPRPQAIGPVFDTVSSTEPLTSFDLELHDQSYVLDRSEDGTSKMPPKPESFSDPYLYPMLTRNERLRLTMMWYYTRDLAGDQELLQRIQAKVDLLKALVGWEFAICGLLENDIYQRLATAGLPLAILPRRESTCAHTVHQAAGSVFFVSDMSDDWRFARSPHVVHGGLRTYAGAQLRCRVEDNQDIALGSLCIASNTPNRALDPSQLDLLSRFADMLTEDIVNGSRQKRAKQQEQNDSLLHEVYADSLGNPADVAILNILNRVFPESQISLEPIRGCSIQLPPGGTPIVLPELHAKSATWEDDNLIDELLRTNNHERLKASRPVRAVIGVVPGKPADTALVVSTTDITRIFDDVDVRFVERCTMILRSIAQERSLQDALRAQERFMRGITHQLRTPIHGILGSVDLLGEEIVRSGLYELTSGSAGDIVPENLKMIKSSGRELMSTVNNVIKLNHWAESVKILENPATLSDLKKLESDILEDVSWLLPEGRFDCVSIFFNNKLPPEVGIVQIDITLLKDCLQSLVLNALQNTVEGSVVITISAAPDYASILFDVQDTGCGIAPADCSRIFDAYEKGNDHSTGAGLGLTLACKIADALSGTVKLVSTVFGKGSHFRAEFRGPGFACPIGSTIMTIAAAGDLPGRFHVVPLEPPSALDEHFTHFLKARQMQLSEEVSGVLAIVSFTTLSDQYQELLSKASKFLIAVSLVPAGKDLSKAKETYPDILLFTGPFTSDRLDEILSEISKIYKARRASQVTDRTSSYGSEVKSLPKKETSLQVSISSRRSSTNPYDFEPNCLLVDDNLINLRIMRMYCDKRKFPYTTAVDGLLAIDEYKAAARWNPVNLILLDLQMPNCDGLQACREIRAFEAKEGLSPAVIFIVTGQDSPNDRADSLAAGANRFYVKPLALKTLDRGIAEIFLKAT